MGECYCPGWSGEGLFVGDGWQMAHKQIKKTGISPPCVTPV
ncbi:hypothetical protein ACLB1E_14290 [Escherichia coli]